ncbi:hypothetical protein TNCV_334461 [Trichonephila clavipes]|nr:hypothetical protein TNCV_334461 [Trichonephila clavipes]
MSLLDFQRSIAVSLVKVPEKVQTDISVTHVVRPFAVQNVILNAARKNHLDRTVTENRENKRTYSGNVKNELRTTILCENDRGESAVKKLNRWPYQYYRPGRFYCVFGGNGKKSFIRSCFRTTRK